MEGRGIQGTTLPPLGSMRPDVLNDQDAVHQTRRRSDLPALDTSNKEIPQSSARYQASPPNHQYYYPATSVSANAASSPKHSSFHPTTRRPSGERSDPHTAPAAGARQSLPSLYEALGMNKTSPRTSNDHSSTPTLPQSSHLSGTVSPDSRSSKPAQSSGYTAQHREPALGGSATRPSYMGRTGVASPLAKSEGIQRQSSPVSPPRNPRDIIIQPQQSEPYVRSNRENNRSQEPKSYPRLAPECSNASQPNASISPKHHAKSLHHQPPPVQPRPTSDSSRPTGIRKSAKHSYGDSVKRHLEVFDLEDALNGVYDASKQLLDFSNYYRQKAHQTQRSGPLPGSTPHIQEIDEMMEHGSLIHESLNRIREVVVAQQAALAERSQEHAMKSMFQVQEESGNFQDDTKDRGFTGSEAKRRRGRAAPPGRCHSCNRAETPEWRRGPDGARTLCNACGLHYAKLTRKMGAGKPSASSNPRPQTEAVT